MSSAVSVIIPCYNGTRFLREALESVFTQTVPPQEIIVVDDASTDGTPELVEECARKSPVPLRVIRLQKNSGGPARPINVGIEHSVSEIIAILDQDDVWAAGTLQSAARVLSGRPNVSFVFSWCGRLDGESEGVLQNTAIRNSLAAVATDHDTHQEFTGEAIARAFLEHGQFVVGYPGFLFRRRDWESKGGVDESLRIASDWDLLAWLCRQGCVALLPRVGYLRREHAHNVCRRRAEMNIECCIVQARILRQWPSLRRDPGLVAQVRNRFAWMAYWLREGGYYTAAIQILWRAIQVSGMDRELAAQAVKVPLRALQRFATRSRPIASPITAGSLPVDT